MTLGTFPQPEGLTDPPINELMEHADSKYALLMFAAKRARHINNYLLEIKEGETIRDIGPLVPYRKEDARPLNIALKEINDGIVRGILGSDNFDPDSHAKVISDADSVSVEDVAAEGDETDEGEEGWQAAEEGDEEEMEDVPDGGGPEE